MRRHAKAPSARPTTAEVANLGRVRRAYAARASASADGRSGSRRAWSLGNLAPVALFLAAALSLVIPAGASADGRIGFEHANPSFGSDTLLPGAIEFPKGVAVSDKNGGDIYVVSSGTGRISEYEPDGTFVRAFGFGIVPGAVSATGDLTVGSNAITNVTTIQGAFSHSGRGGVEISGPGIAPNTYVTFVSQLEVQLSKPAVASGTDVPLTVAAGPGNIPTNERQQVTVSATGGEFSLSFTSPKPGSTTDTTANLDAGVSAAELQTALEGLPNIGAGNVAVSRGSSPSEPYVIEFTGRYADVNVLRLSATNVSLTGGSPSSEVTVTTPQEGGGVVETCTSACVAPSAEENSVEDGEGQRGSQPGNFFNASEIAIDNDEASASYGDVYVVDADNFRIEKFSPEGQFLLMFGGEVDKTTGADVCTAADVVGGDICAAGVPGTGPSHFYKEEPGTEAGGFKEWSRDGSNSIAVGPDGTVYVGDLGRIQEFEPNGTFAGEFSLGEAEPKFVGALAIDSSGNIYERSALADPNGAVRSEVPGVREYDSAHALVRTFDTEAGSRPTHVAVDEAGDVFVSDGVGSEAQFKEFNPAGTLIAVFKSDQVAAPCDTCDAAHGIALGEAAGKLYATASRPEESHVAVIPLPESGPPTVSEESAGDIETTTATLHAVVNPRGFNTEYHFEYVSQAAFENEGGFSSPATASTASVNLGLVNQDDPVQAPISGLTPGTVYHFRAVAENSEGVTTGPDETFEALPPVSVRDFTTQTVGPEQVELKAELNPNGSATTYEIKLGETTAYDKGSVSGSLSIANEFEPVTAQFKGLKSNTTYHYELIAENEYGQINTGDRTLRTELSEPEERDRESCPNTNLREENHSLDLPDCRAYEQASETHKEGSEVTPGEFAFAGSGERVMYYSFGAFDGASQNELAIQYLGQRSETGWSTIPFLSKRLAPAGEEPVLTTVMSPSLDRWILLMEPGINAEEARVAQKTGYTAMGFDDGSFVLPASPVVNVQEGDPRPAFQFMPGSGPGEETSEDLSRAYIYTQTRLLSTDPREDGYLAEHVSKAAHADRVYELTGIGSSEPKIRLLTELPPGLATSDNLVGTGCAINSDADEQNGFGSSGAGTERRVSADGSVYFFTAPIEKVAGAKCGEGTPNPLAIFATVDGGTPFRVDAAPPSQCTAPAPCATGAVAVPSFIGSSPNGKLAWFSTTQPLINQDVDSTRDVYVAKLEGGSIKELALASEGDGSDPMRGSGARFVRPVRLSPDGTHLAFLAEGVLTAQPNALGEKAEDGKENLYIYDAGSGAIRFVTDCGVGSGRFTPDGRFLAFNSSGHCTSDDTDEQTDVFRYDFQTGELIRLSFGRNGNDGNGNDDEFLAALNGEGGGLAGSALTENGSRAISADGGVVIFQTRAPLVSHDTNAKSDIYMWEEDGHGTCRESGGCVSLVSDGVDPHGTESAVISSSGNGIAFQTARGFSPGDTDGVGDIYVARVDGGFHTARRSTPCGTPEGCRGALGTAPEPPVLGTEQFVGPGNGKEHRQCAKGRRRVVKHGQVRCVKRRHHKKRHRRGRHHGGKHGHGKHRHGRSRVVNRNREGSK